MGSYRSFTRAQRRRISGRKNTKVTEYENSPRKVFLIHDNRLGYYTTIAHKLAEMIDNDPRYEVIYDLNLWSPQEKPSTAEINKKLIEAAKEADLFVRVVPPSSKLGERRHEGPKTEIRKGIYAGKPLLELFVGGSHSSPNRPIQEINYKKRVALYLTPKQRLTSAFYKGIEEMEKRRIIEKDEK